MASRWRQLWSSLRHAFAMQAGGPLEPEDQALLHSLAQEIVRRRLDSVVLLTLQAALPLSFLGSQALYAAKPLASVFHQVGGEQALTLLGPLAGIARQLVPPEQLERLARLLEWREHVESLMALIEEYSAEQVQTDGTRA